jgi:hypothetical protein
MFKVIILLLSFVMFFASSAISSGQHESGAHKGDVETSAMPMKGEMAIVGNYTSKGIKGMAHLKDVTETMAAMGMKTTHQFMIAFVDEETGNQVTKGKVTLQITKPDAKVEKSIEMVNMDGHFSADVVMDTAGEYHFKLATKLEDGTNRKFHFHQEIQ